MAALSVKKGPPSPGPSVSAKPIDRQAGGGAGPSKALGLKKGATGAGRAGKAPKTGNTVPTPYGGPGKGGGY